MSNRYKILITGGRGFIGRHLLDSKLLDQHQLFLLVRDVDGLPAAESCQMIQGDVTDINTIRSAVKGIDVVIHLAAETRDESLMEAVNKVGTENLVAVAVEQRVRMFIHLSSVGVAGRQHSIAPLIVNEKVDCTPQNKYETTKLAAEHAVLGASASMQVCVLRPSNVFGEDHPFHALLGLCRHLQKGNSVPVMRDSMLNYVYVDDVCKVISTMVVSDLRGVYNVNDPMLVSKFLPALGQLVNSNTPSMVILPEIIFSIIKGFGYFGISKLKEKLVALSNKVVYLPNKLLSETNMQFETMVGLERTVNYFKEKGLL